MRHGENEVRLQALLSTLIILKEEHHEVFRLHLVMFMMMYFSLFYEDLETRFKMLECRTVRHLVSPVPE